MSLINLIDFQSLGDGRGELVSLENNKNIPFEVKRVYYIVNTQENVVRGLHAHRQLHQVAVVISGSCKFILDDGKTREEVVMSSPVQGLKIGPGTWREMCDFSKDCVLIVLASELYDESDYIRNYEEFIKETNK